MSNAITRQVLPRERVMIWLLVLIERCALAMLPRGPLRKRVLRGVDRALHRIHDERSEGCCQVCVKTNRGAG